MFLKKIWFLNYSFLSITISNMLSKDIFLLFRFLKFVIKKYFYTINHKRLGLNYFYLTLVSGLSGSLLATAIRIEMAYPKIGRAHV